MDTSTRSLPTLSLVAFGLYTLYRHDEPFPIGYGFQTMQGMASQKASRWVHKEKRVNM
jgi:hypothetical protein